MTFIPKQLPERNTVPPPVETLANDAFEAYSALMATETIRPQLLGNPTWVAMRSEAYALFCFAFMEAGK